MKDNFERDITAFFKIYNVFAKADSLTSVTKVGRSREMVGHFLVYFGDIYSKDTAKISESKKLVIDNLENYLDTHEAVDCLKQYSYSKVSVVANKNKNAALERSFKIFLKAAELYSEHRSALTNDEIVKIYTRNASEYYVTAFGQNNLDGFKDNIESFLINKKVNKITMLKQSLMEFNNAISHLNNAISKGTIDKNPERAEQHFNRGSLDFYKSIIRELSMLDKISTISLEALEKIRCFEYDSIGEERHIAKLKTHSKTKTTVYDDYHAFCNRLITKPSQQSHSQTHNNPTPNP